MAVGADDGYAVGSGGFRNNIGRLWSLGLIQGPTDGILLTTAGTECAVAMFGRLEQEERVAESHECFECGERMEATDPGCLAHLDREMEQEVLRLGRPRADKNSNG